MGKGHVDGWEGVRMEGVDNGKGMKIVVVESEEVLGKGRKMDGEGMLDGWGDVWGGY